MQHDDILAKLAIAKKNWEIIKSDHGVCTESKKFLKGTYLVANHASAQIELDGYSSNIRDTVLKNKGILKEIEINKQFLGICKEYAQSEKKLESVLREDSRNKAVDELKTTRAKLENLDQLSLLYREIQLMCCKSFKNVL